MIRRPKALGQVASPPAQWEHLGIGRGGVKIPVAGQAVSVGKLTRCVYELKHRRTELEQVGAVEVGAVLQICRVVGHEFEYARVVKPNCLALHFVD